jgi:hypothetical protein
MPCFQWNLKPRPWVTARSGGRDTNREDVSLPHAQAAGGAAAPEAIFPDQARYFH